MSIEPFFRYLPYRFALAAARLPDDMLKHAFEIRLRLGGASSVSVKDRNVPFGEKGVTSVENAMRASEDEMEKCLSLLCKGSVYAFSHTLRNGFIPIENGRAGICGDAITDVNGNIVSFRRINSISIRKHGSVNGFADRLISYYARNGVCGTLIYAPPMLGKTTLLRSLCMQLSTGKGIRPYRVGIVDERNEIVLHGYPVGMSDVISGCPKAISIELLTRSMAPQVIACDELTENESDAVCEAQNTGVYLIATAHGKDLAALMRRDFIKRMTEKRIFDIAVRIKNGFEYDIENI